MIGKSEVSSIALLSALAAIAAPAAAQDAAASIDPSDIVVTAQRREERLQDVPISITVFNQEQLNDRNISSADELAAYTPSLTASTRYGANNASFAIRGFTQELRTAPSVGVYFAEVVAPRAPASVSAGEGAGPGAFFDLQNVQVLKGPQGTLFGRNTTGGAVLLVPQKPTDALEGYVEGTIGNYDYRRLQGVLNLPLAETFRVRLGVDHGKRDGYLRNISGVGPDRFGNRNYLSVRASVVGDLTPDLENYLIAAYSRSNDHGPIGTIQGCTNAFPFGLLACQQIARQAGLGDRVVQNNLADPQSLSKTWQVINRTTWQASEAITVRNIASYGEVENFLKVDIFGTRWTIPSAFGPIPNTGPLAGLVTTFAPIIHAPNTPTAASSTFTEELQIQGRAGALEWQVGGYLEVTRPSGNSGSQAPLLLACTNSDAFQCTDVFGALLRRPGTGSISYGVGRQNFRNVGLYAQGTYALTPELKLTGGLRYTWDKARASTITATYRFLAPNVPTAFCTFPGIGPGNTVPLPGANPEPCRTDIATRTSAPTWVAGIDWNPDRDLLLYAKYSRGYRQGNINPFAPPPYQTFDAERVDAYEAGLKASFHGAVSGTFNLAAFYNNFSNQQLTIAAQSSTNAATPTQILVNAGSSRIYGIEVETTIRPFAGFDLSASYAYLDTRLNSIEAVTASPGSPYDIFTPTSVPGQVLPLTPKHKLSATAAYRLPLPQATGEVRLSATYSYASKILVSSTALGTLPGVGLWNLNLNWDGVLGLPVDASAFVLNVTDKVYYNVVADQTSQGFVSRTYGEPRTYGLRLRYRFGS